MGRFDRYATDAEAEPPSNRFSRFAEQSKTRQRQNDDLLAGVGDAALGAADGFTFGWGDEAVGLVNKDWRDAWRANSQRAQQYNPWAYYGGMVAGGLVPGAGALSLGFRGLKALPGIGAAARGAAGALSHPGLSLGGRMAAGAVIGVPAGAIAGAGFADNHDRLQGALIGGAFGAPLGAAAPLVNKVGGAALNALKRSVRPTAPAYGPVIEGAVPTGAGMAPPQIADSALEEFARTMSRSPRKTVADMEEYVAAAQSDPGRGRTFMDAMERAGTKRMRAEVSRPGDGADLAERQFLERARGADDRLERGVTGVQSGDPLEVMNARVTEAAQKHLSPWFSRVDQRNAQTVLENMSKRPTARDALKEADRQIEEMVAAGSLPPSATGSAAHRLHFARIVLQAGARDPSRMPNSLRSMSNANLVSASNAITSALDAVTPGYRAALEALRREMQPRQMARAVRTARRTDRSNVAGNTLSNPQVRRALDEMPDFANALRTEDDLFRNAQRVMSGSDTAANLSEMMSAAATMPKAAPSIAGAVQGAWRATFGELGDSMFGAAAEKRSGDLVRMMLQRVDDPDPVVRAQVRGFLTQLETKLADMRRRSAISGQSAADSANVGSFYSGTDDGYF